MKHTKELFDLTGTVAIVTGGRGLYGASISLGLCEMGATVVISSMRGLDCPHFPFYPDTWPDQPVTYTTEKWAMVGLTKYMAGRYGKQGIRVNCIAPGGFDPGLANDPDKQAFQQTYIENCPLGCETPRQVQENVDLFNRCVTLSADQLAEIRSCFTSTPVRVLNPSLW